MPIKPIPLTDHDLRQMDDEWVSALTAAEKEALLVRALFELRKSRDRLNQSPRNSSKPPSSRAPWEATPADGTGDEPSSADDLAETPSAAADTNTDTPRADKAATPDKTTPQKRAGGKGAPKKKAGKQVGAQGFGRTQKLACTDAEAHHPHACAGCGKGLEPGGALAYTAWDDIDIAEKVAGQVGLYLKVTRHTLYASACPCGHVTRAAHNVAPDDPFWDKVALGQWRLIGPRLAGAIVFLALRMRLSRARIREFFFELFELQLSTGVRDETIREPGRAVAALEDEMAEDIEQAVLLHADETPWKEAGKPLWMWVFVAGFTTLFYICSRGLEILSNVLSDKFKGNLMSDGYQAYRHLGRRLRCWAHLIRKCQGMIDSTDARVVAAGKGMHDVLHTLMAAIYGARAAPSQGNGALLN